MDTNNLTFTVTFDEVVNVTGTPQLQLDIGGGTRFADYTSGDTTDTLTFQYTVTIGDNDNDGIGNSSPIGLNSGTIQDDAGNNASLGFTTPDTSGVTVDTQAPSLLSVSKPADATYIPGQTLTFTANFDEPVYVTNAPRIELDIGGTQRFAGYASGSASANLDFEYVIQAGDNDTDGITSVTPVDLNTTGLIRDVATNNATLSYTPPTMTNVLVDSTAPTVVTVVGPASGTYPFGANVDFTVSYSENVVVTGFPRIQLNVGGSTLYATYSSGTTSDTLVFRYTVGAGENDSNGIGNASPIQLNSGTIRDVPGNNAVLTFTPPNTTGVDIDTTQPQITSVTPPTPNTYIEGQTVQFVVNFDEAVDVTNTPRIRLDVGGVTLYANYADGTGTANLDFDYIVGSGDYDFDGIENFSPIDMNTTGTIEDSVGNAAIVTFSAPSTSTVYVDTAGPVILTQTMPADGSYKQSDTLDFVYTWNEPAYFTGNPRLELQVGAGTQYADYLSGSGTTLWTFRYTVGASQNDNDGIVLNSPIDLTAPGTIRDIVTNNATVTFSPPSLANVFIDTVTPTISSVTKPADATYALGQTLVFQANFSESVTISGNPRIPLTIGASGRNADYASGSGSSNIVFELRDSRW